MKHIFSILTVTLLLTACGQDRKITVESVLEANNLEAIRTKRAELVATQEGVNSKIELLDARIKELDTTTRIPLITTIKAKEVVFNHVLELQGNVTTKDLLIITPEYSGILTNVYVREGQRVTKGQTLAKIDDGGLSQQLAQFKIQADLAKTTFERQERLWNQKIGSEIQYLQAKSSYESQQQAINQLQQQINKTKVRAPFSGTIDDVITEKGSVVGAGQTPLMQIVNLNNMYVETDVPESYVPSVTKGKNVTVDFPVLGKSLETKIRQAGSVINATNRTFKVEIGIPNKDKSIKPNLTAKLKINDYTNEKAILVPQSIISENAEGEQYVYIVKEKKDNDEGKVNKVIIKTGKTQGDTIEVLKGIKNGTELILEGARSVKEGQTVKVINY
ncbi:efflux RND transporter periplasmic adaptor subunit [Lacinutrix sp.]|uniref:efflux RND transporter periplasmic adaptor subunit n=1 Tax=Lacinutrix sp. TaxID=1937692 RepID=UPI0025C12920|nr:efflux RND transporter periplasmic adaptor subunit [Lacinutrix sp.]